MMFIMGLTRQLKLLSSAGLMLFAAFMFSRCFSDASGKQPSPVSDTKAHTASCAVVPSRAAAIAASKSLETPLSKNAPEEKEMVLIKPGVFTMGSKEFEDAQPLHQVKISPFWMDTHEVTNAEFATFVKETGYKTVAERPLDPKDYPSVPADKLVPGSAVFTPPTQKVSLNDPLQWWTYSPGANWKQPKGPGSSIAGRDNDPVVQVCFEDAAAYAKWAGKDFPRKPSGNMPQRVRIKMALITGVMNSSPVANGWRTFTREVFPNTIRRMTDTPSSRP